VAVRQGLRFLRAELPRILASPPDVLSARRPTMKFVAIKTADQLDLQALHRVRERLVSQRTGGAGHQ
jgi:hypothetical protein